MNSPRQFQRKCIEQSIENMNADINMQRVNNLNNVTIQKFNMF